VQESDLPSPLTNSVTATGTSPTGSEVDADDTASVTLTSTPALAVSVTPSTDSAEVGEEITYSYRVTNTGNVTLSDVSATDDTFGSIISGETLAPDAEVTGSTSYTVQESDLPSPLTNSVTATGTSPTGSEVDADDTASVTLTSTPDLTVSVTPSTDSAEVGEEITYSYRVVNSGNVTLSGVSATDDTFGSIISGETLAPDAEVTGSTSYTVQESDLPSPLANTVTATGKPPVGDAESDTASASVGVTQTSGIRIKLSLPVRHPNAQ
jgi:uncharacterized protein (DUF58 family)